MDSDTRRDNNAYVLSVNTGGVHEHGEPGAKNPLEREWTSAIFKTPVEGIVAGDAQADLENHGGPDKAVCVYPEAHYGRWKEELPDYDWTVGGFGENLSVSMLNEHLVCIGDVFQLGDTTLQVSQPRQPCHKLARRWNIKDLPKRVHDTARCGWYFRVLQEGEIQAGQALELSERHYPQWTVATVAHIIRHVGDDFDEAERLYTCKALSQVLRDFLRTTIDKHRPKPPGPLWRLPILFWK